MAQFLRGAMPTRNLLLLIWVTFGLLGVASGHAYGQDTKRSVFRGISYLEKGNVSDYAREQCQIDLYLPTKKSGFATVVWFHGGGLKAGHRKSGEKFAKRFTTEGHAVVSVGYRFSPKVKSPAYIEDAATAVAWTFKNIHKYGGDPKKIFVSGHSAGGYLTSMIGLDGEYLRKHHLACNQLAGCMPIAGQMATHFTIREERGIPKERPIVDEYAPIYHVNKNAPPFLCFAADKDLPTRAEENIFFASAMKASGHNETECYVIKNRDHGSVAGRFLDPHDEVSLRMLAFMDRIIEQDSKTK